MSLNQAALNRVWTQVLIEECYRQGVRHICIAPGSRSTPLTLEAVAHPDMTVHTHFDERGLGFLALGLAKSTHTPVAVIVTSGTAVANLLPAVAESKLTKEPLVLLTSDRPVELVGCGANQAIEQSGIFSQHVTHALNLPSPSTQVPLSWLLTSVDHAFAEQKQKGSSIHINCPFPEPLYGGEDKSAFNDYLSAIDAWLNSEQCYVTYSEPLPSRVDVEDITALNLGLHKGTIIVGNVTLAEAEKAKALGVLLGWPVLFDPQSGTHDKWQRYDMWLQNVKLSQKLSETDLIVQFGSRLVSKRLLAWVDRQVSERCDYLVVLPYLDRLNPSHLRVNFIHADIQSWLESASSVISNSSHKGWADRLSLASHCVLENVPQRPHITEFDVARTIEQLPQDTALFIGNSLIVRLVDMVTGVPSIETFTNRGASGIDGLVATAAGVQRGIQGPLVLYIGDTSLLYDLNSLALFSNVSTPSVIVVTNNDGGAIFDILPAPAEHKKQCYQMPHGYRFEHAAKQFGLQYAAPASSTELSQALSTHLEQGVGALLLEVTTDPHEVSTLIRELSQSVAQ
ncbi:2-succinyl-5-enolpyruvyl-6-hydroxy-3-cyclohexene-1-carboxylic-acid synthase [Vibrio maritimus]|uniref:2-succinyl-5-enolpyruvyl-6-hydroxy-3- cyclohexene-1-carboxylic-acid synthase n=1 Tax=Vibrio maritimus TaxID=990268 RepID=UPI001F42C57A|nr:2-succinyl-5-enolpyruvyl-6-hydroxy-3-cyclohexene-1-carboxylic-acid synthase [Vibrio maritimus]